MADYGGGGEESMTSVAAPFHPTHTTGNWEDFEKRVGGVAPALALFALGCAPLVWLDRALLDPEGSTALLMPSAGLLFVALWMSRPSRWPALLMIHMLIALALGALWSPPDTVLGILLAIVPVPACALFGAVFTMLLIRVPIQLEIWQVPRAIIGGALGGLVGALITVLMRSGAGPAGPSFKYDLFSTWASLGLGAVTLGAATLMWVLTIRAHVPELRLRSRKSLLGIAAWILVAGAVGVVLLDETHTAPLTMPIIAGPALVFGCFRLPPRWAVTLSALFILEYAFISTHRTGPYSIVDPYVRNSLQQLLFGIFATVPFLLSIGVTQLRIIVARQAQLNAQLVSDQERLRSYARQLAAAEEKARRATAVDLHDGIGQTLAGMLMIVEVARQQSAPTAQGLLDDLRLRLREIQDLTRRMISDMSPPGLYDLGLGAALQWLAANMRAESGLSVGLDCRFDERRLRLDTRVLVFKLVRELLRNVVKHAGVTSAQVTVEESGDWLRIIVSDEGRGFEWKMEMSGERNGRFGLWSVADRIRDVGGVFEVYTAIGGGARFVLKLPLPLASGWSDDFPLRLQG
jgi:signal transduction histidine kinase